MNLDKNFVTTLVHEARRLIRYLRSTRTPGEIAPLDKATNKATNTDQILAERSITVPTVDTTGLKL
jgi:hypothetical protein